MDKIFNSKSYYKNFKRAFVLFIFLLLQANARTGFDVSAVTFLDASGCIVEKNNDTLKFGEIAVGDSNELSFIIENIHPSSDISSTDIDNSNNIFSLNVSMFTLTAGLDLTVNVKCKPVTKDATIIDAVTFTGNFPDKKVYLKVIAVNGIPYFNTSGFLPEAKENEAYDFSFNATDPDGDNITYTKISAPAWMNITTSGVCSGTPGFEDGGGNPKVVRVKISDGDGGERTKSFDLIVNNTDRPPAITFVDTIKGAEGVEVSETATASDPDGDAVTITFEDYPSWISVSTNTVSGTYTDNSTFDSLIVKATTIRAVVTKKVFIKITNTNEQPVITSSGTAAATEDLAFKYIGTATDIDGTEPAITFANIPSWMTISEDTIKGTPVEGVGDTSFTVIASDDKTKLSDSKIVTVTVTPVNDPPVIVSYVPVLDTVTLPFDTSINFSVTVSDTDNSLSSLVTGWLYDNATVTMPYKVSKEGFHVLTYYVWDKVADTVKHSWVCNVQNKIVTVGETVDISIPSDGIINLSDSASSDFSINFTSGDFAGKKITFTLLTKDSVPDQLDGLFFFKIETDITGAFSANLTLENDNLEEKHIYVWYDQSQSTWQKVVSNVDLNNKTITAVTDHFSIWAVIDGNAVDILLKNKWLASLPKNLMTSVYPNPVKSVLHIKYGVPYNLHGKNLNISIYNIAGKRIANLSNSPVNAGWYSVAWDPNKTANYVSSGMYFYCLTIGNKTLRKKFIFTR